MAKGNNEYQGMTNPAANNSHVNPKVCMITPRMPKLKGWILEGDVPL